jgi:GH15 family glucan-1,4-alpha-glucosidase
VTTEPHQAPTDHGFVPIANYALLSDCENTCLVAPSGAVEWLCLPLPHDPSAFSAVLDRAAGSFRISPAAFSAPVDRRYVPGTLILETIWQTPQRLAKCHRFHGPSTEAA